MIRFFLGVDPATLSVEQWAEAYQQVIFSLGVVRKIIWGEDKAN